MMERKHKISEYRERLDKTLASHDLTNERTLKTLVRNQLVCSSQDETEGDIGSVLEKRTMEVSKFLDMLRSASVNDNEMLRTCETPHGEWKLKQDTEDYRVMYRQGPQGTPFHTLLVEGYVDAPIDVCLCVSWESTLYKKWWPQFSVPTFKIISGQCLKKVRIGEQISSVRMKLSWPLSDREALLHYIEFDYLEEDLVIILLNSISDLERIERSTHGFTNDGIPEAKDMVRIDVVGGFALQKVTPDRSYFRTIASMDIKLDFVPPSLINFISRQLIGNGFRLYKKVVASISNYDEDFSKALEDPMYNRLREAIYSNNKANRALEPEDLKSDTCVPPEEDVTEAMQNNMRDMDQMVPVNENVTESSPESTPVIDRNALVEIEEEEIEESRCLEKGSKETDHYPTKQIAEKWRVNNKRNVCLSLEVEQALGTLEKVISMVREFGFNDQPGSPSSFVDEEFPNLEKGAGKNSTSLEDGGICTDSVVSIEASKEEIAEKTSDDHRNSSCIPNSRRIESNSYSRELNHNRIAPASPEQTLSIPSETHPVASRSPKNGTTGAPILDETTNGNRRVSAEANGIHENSLKESKKLSRQRKNRYCCRKNRYCCLPLNSGH